MYWYDNSKLNLPAFCFCRWTWRPMAVGFVVVLSYWVAPRSPMWLTLPRPHRPLEAASPSFFSSLSLLPLLVFLQLLLPIQSEADLPKLHPQVLELDPNQKTFFFVSFRQNMNLKEEWVQQLWLWHSRRLSSQKDTTWIQSGLVPCHSQPRYMTLTTSNMG